MPQPLCFGPSEGLPTGGCYTWTGVTSGDHNTDGSEEPQLARVPAARAIPTLAEDAARYLIEPPRSIPPKYFYDARGSTLFDAICEAPEYYPTRTERRLLKTSAPAIMSGSRPDHLLELGSGSASKTRLLLDAWPGRGDGTYWPFDVSDSFLSEVAVSLEQEYPALDVSPLVGDYSGGLAGLPPMPGRVLVVFLGGTIGNFPPAEAVAFLSELATWMDDDDCLLIGFDRVKDTAVLEAAYNDAAGLTASFNLNVLRVLNRELGADFDLEAFEHRSVYDADKEQIEMYLIARTDQTVNLPGLPAQLGFSAGERILTEISRKFTVPSLTNLLETAGFALVENYQPEDGWYSLVLARKA